MTASDRNLLTGIRAALATPFADPVEVFGLRISRGTARAMERQLYWAGRVLPLSSAGAAE